MSVDLEFDYDDAVSAMDNFSKEDIDEIRQWTQKFDTSSNVPKDLTNKQLVLFYNACYCDVEKTKLCLQNYYNCRKNAPEFFNHRVLTSNDLKQASEAFEFFVLPEKSREGYEIIFHRLQDDDPSKFIQESSFKLLFMTVDLCLSSQGPQSGYIFIFDMQGVKFGHLTRINLLGLRKLFRYVQDAVPVRVKGIHVLNTESILDKLMLLLKPFIDKKFFDLIKFHKKAEDLEKLYEIVSKSSLPSNYGGDLLDSQALHKLCMEKLRSMEPYFRAEEEQRFAAMPGNNRNGENLQGSFKQLE